MEKKALLNEHRAADFLDVSVKTLQKWRYDSGGPVYVKVGRMVRYRPEDLDSYLNANKVDPIQ